MKFLVPNYSCLQNPWLGGYRHQIPVLSVLNWICWNPRKKFLGTPLLRIDRFSWNFILETSGAPRIFLWKGLTLRLHIIYVLFKNYVMKIISKSVSRYLSRLQGKLKPKKKIYIFVSFYYIFHYSTALVISGARGGVVVKALHYKPAGRGFDSRSCHWNSSVT